MNKLSKLIGIGVMSTFITACVTPGQHLSTSGKNIVNEVPSGKEEADFDSLVNVYELTPQFVNSHRTSSPTATVNRSMDEEIANYQYRVGPADILNVTVWDHPELTIPAGSYRSTTESGNWVHTDGRIYYPYIGFVTVEGKTVVEIRDEMSKRLAEFIESPQVDVNVANFRSQKTYVTGEVKNPGKQPITNVPLTLLDAINQAGGLGEDADWRNVTLTRNGKEIQVSLYALMQKGDLTQNHLLHAGDIIHVPRNDGQKVFVMGEVKTPKTITIDRAGMSLTEALSTVGGLDQNESDATGVFVIRGNKQFDVNSNQDETEVKIASPIANVYQLDISDATAMVIGTSFEMQPYDIVYVTTEPISRWNRVVSNLLPTFLSINYLTQSYNRTLSW
ncbi:polysaccharide export protein [uncultured Shewanella sp.]|uniref:polysaccharide export protein n=1 Tax=uncultured Shewanella sp. TaxID=173975 RepID=UPI002632E8C8|nr:polysaccharide export protein [uncultured Shewanella sp.]